MSKYQYKLVLNKRLAIMDAIIDLEELGYKIVIIINRDNLAIIQYKQMDEETKKILEYSDTILGIIDRKEDFTRGDLQGTLEAIVKRIIHETRAEKNKKKGGGKK